LGRQSITLGILDLVVDFFPEFLSLLFSIRLGGLALVLHELVSRLLSVGDALFDLPARLALYLPHAGATLLAHLPSVVGENFGLPRGLHSPVLGLPSTLTGVLRTPHPDFD
jgi:hypothetical protein